jgi:GNAT superfamily N-acetyltransferase
MEDYILDKNIGAYIVASENYSKILRHLLKKIAFLRWGDDESKLDNWMNTLKNTPSDDFTSFFVFAIKERTTLSHSQKHDDIDVIGFAYFCQDENNENQWYCGDLAVHPKYRRLGIFKRLTFHGRGISGRLGVAEKILEQGLHELRGRNKAKLFTHIDKNDKFLKLSYKRLSFWTRYSFIPSEEKNNINGFDKNDKIAYECML